MTAPTLRRVAVLTTSGKFDVEARVWGSWCSHPRIVSRPDGSPTCSRSVWSVSHVPTGLSLDLPDFVESRPDRDTADRVAYAIDRHLASADPKKLERAVAGIVAAELEAAW